MSDHALKTLAILNSKAPYSDSAGKDSVDIALVFGSFEQPVSLFFQGDGVWQLVQGQDGSAIAVKDYLKTFSAFEFYDIEDIYVCQNSLEQRNLPASFHIEAVQVLNQRDFAERLTSHHTIFRF
ncbi:sulfurtransferase complex subunit TusC [Colwellia sp. 6_MG-2023]|uniref:sulfurtransferase complex subunit TusC n=1 Tax=Colwellia sp. 6_MG-2023 TaxID=3062676 RepID=UPI0026E1203B|nr:sulfurtransferase complex subunit TusC [Colwellia sp. 6_MG-2023]MDO6487434.1 sulfurtransferase complex subunit TusC [Colwellia sp. 6_MG-2023]